MNVLIILLGMFLGCLLCAFLAMLFEKGIDIMFAIIGDLYDILRKRYFK